MAKTDDATLSECEVVREPLRSFEAAMSYADDLIEIAKRQTGRGRRTSERALNRAVVVMTVAAWQVLVEELTKTSLEYIAAPSDPDSLVDRALHFAIHRDAEQAIKRLTTPNAASTKQLLAIVGIQADAQWQVSFGPQRMTSNDVSKEINCWLDVRHKIAHGDPDLPNNKVLCKTVGGPTLRRKEAERCMRFFRRVGLATALEADARLCETTE